MLLSRSNSPRLSSWHHAQKQATLQSQAFNFPSSDKNLLIGGQSLVTERSVASLFRAYGRSLPAAAQYLHGSIWSELTDGSAHTDAPEPDLHLQRPQPATHVTQPNRQKNRPTLSGAVQLSELKHFSVKTQPTISTPRVKRWWRLSDSNR